METKHIIILCFCVFLQGVSGGIYIAEALIDEKGKEKYYKEQLRIRDSINTANIAIHTQDTIFISKLLKRR